MAELPQKRDKSIKQEIFNETIFNPKHNLTTIDPKKGLSHGKIDISDVLQIPGMSKHWHFEIENRKKEVQDYLNQGFMQRAMSMLAKTKQSWPRATGEEIAKLHPTKQAVELVNSLKKDPTDMLARLELVSIVGKSSREFALETYRALYLQAVHACCYGKVSTVGLQIVLWAQEMYCSKLSHKCRSEAGVLAGKLADNQRNPESIYAQFADLIRDRIKLMSRNYNILQLYLKHFAKAKSSIIGNVNAVFEFNEVTSYILDDELGSRRRDKEEHKKKLVKKINQVVLLLRYIPLLFNETDRLLKHFQKVDMNNPVYHLLKARLSMSELVLRVARHEGGFHDADNVKEINTVFKECYHQYGLAVRKVGKNPKSSSDYTILIEFASLIHYFYRVSINILNINLPREWLKTAFSKSLDSLMLAQESGKVAPVMDSINKDILHAELDIRPTVV